MLGKGDDDRGDEFFDGMIDEVRILDYQSMAFAGGLMISSVAGNFVGAGTITVYNSADHAIDLTGIELLKNSNPETGCATLSGSLAAGATTTASCTSLNQIGMVYLADLDGDNNADIDSGADAVLKEWVIDAVCWNTGGSSAHGSCSDSDDPIIAAGLWVEDASVNDAFDQGVELVTLGDNDDGVSDWKAIPEFGTLLMPVASVLLIVGYNYRRKESEA